MRSCSGSSLSSVLALPLLTLGILASACGGSVADAPSSLGDAGPSDDGGPSASSACSPLISSDLPPGSSSVTGTLVGNDLHATLCPGGAFARIQSTSGSTATTSYIFVLNYAVGAAASGPDFSFQAPADATNAEMATFLGISSASPGEYSGPTGGGCGSIALTYFLPSPASLDCDASAPPNCPAGCGTECSGFGCAPCTPQAPGVSFSAQGATDCIGDTQTPSGSWKLSLTSVTPSDASTDPTLTYFEPHGTFTANLEGADAGTAVLSVSF